MCNTFNCDRLSIWKERALGLLLLFIGICSVKVNGVVDVAAVDDNQDNDDGGDSGDDNDDDMVMVIVMMMMMIFFYLGVGWRHLRAESF